MLQSISEIQNQFLSTKTQAEKKLLGQFFTGVTISKYMASFISENVVQEGRLVRILDSGAGIGILSAAAALECLNRGCTEVHIEAFEVDPLAIPYLNDTYNELLAHFALRGGVLTFVVNSVDFVLTRPDRIANSQFDIAVINPPYFKYSAADSPYSKTTLDLYKGDPNIYASFMAITLSCLRPNGQMIAIVPRSFTNGLYFKDFRRYLLGNGDVNAIHIFKKRNEVFKDVEVLQENIICNLFKRVQQNQVTIYSSNSSLDIDNREQNTYPVNLVIDYSNDQKIIRIPESREQYDILETAEQLPTNFVEAGYFISTGPVVEFRTKEFHTVGLNNAVPLLKSHNFNSMGIIKADGSHPKDIGFMLGPASDNHLVLNKTYVLLKRITSKDESRRLVAGVYESSLTFRQLGISNKLNYLGVKNGELSNVEAYGLSAFLNSTFMDNYFRCISGNTQVNSNEVRLMKFPYREKIINLGNEMLRRHGVPTQELIDNLVDAIILETVKT